MSDKIAKPPPISSSSASVLQDITMKESSSSTAMEKEDLWIVSETFIKPISPFHPPMDTKCVTFVNESNGCIITNRIANCLRELSIVVEYDDRNVSLL